MDCDIQSSSELQGKFEFVSAKFSQQIKSAMKVLAAHIVAGDGLNALQDYRDQLKVCFCC